jgi:hypothetical protein
LTVASTPKKIENFLADARANRTTPADVASLNKIAAQVPVVAAARQDLRKLKKANAPEAALKPPLDKLDKAFDIIGQHLGDLFAGEAAGTDTQPLDLDWPKPAWSAYKPLYLYRVGPKAAPAWKLTAKEKKPQKPVKTYFPSGSHQVGDTSLGTPPAELDKLGIESPYRVAKNTKVGPLSDASTPGGGKINTLLGKYGWSADDEGLDGDHVKEIQLGGKDELANLWPLDASTNRGAGSKLSRSQVLLAKERATVDLLKKVKLSPADKKKVKFTFKIRSVTS